MTNLMFYTQVSSQCRYPTHADDGELYCVTSYVLKYPLEDSDDWTEYRENGMSKVIIGHARDLLFRAYKYVKLIGLLSVL